MSFDFDLDSVLVEPTIVRPEVEQQVQQPASSFAGLEFEELPKEEEKTGTPELPEGIKEEHEVELSPYDAAENADILVDMLDEINKLSMTPLARWKARQKRGGKQEIIKMSAIASKHYNEQELTKKEKNLLNQYQAYLKDKAELEKAIPYTEAELKKLKKSAEAYLKRVKWKVGDGGAAFWTEFSIIQGSRVIEILTV